MLDGNSLRWQDVIAVARGTETVTLQADARERMRASRKIVEDHIAAVLHRHSQRVAALLESLGGRRLSQPDGEVHGFPTAPAREDALDLVRLTYGWTVAVSIR